MDDSQAPEDGPVQFVAIKAPPFLETAATAWFAILEAQFHLRSIKSEETKFYHALAALPPEIISRLPADVLSSSTYSSLKSSVIGIYESTKPELFEQLISTTKLTGRPSVFLQEISQIASKVGVNEELVRHKFIQSLHSSISPVLAAQKDLTLSQLGKLADELLPLAQSNIFNVQSSNSRPSSPFRNQASTSRHPSQFHNQPFHSRSTSHFNHIQKNLRPFHENQRPSVCRAHIFYGTKARSCRNWCQWPNKNNITIMPNSRPSTPVSSRSPSPNRTPKHAEPQSEN